MRYGILCSIGGLLLVAHAVFHGGLDLLWLWPALGLLWVAAGYFFLGARVFSKQAKQGRLPLPSLLVNAPYLLTTWFIWHLTWLVRREDKHNHIAANLWLGRRPLHLDELPDSIRLVVDVTSEFNEVRAFVTEREYRCLPMLDGSICRDGQALADLCAELVDFDGDIYIHCAMGHGRSASVLAMVLVRKGLASSVPEAVRMMRAQRPRVVLNRAQRRMIEQLLAE